MFTTWFDESPEVRQTGRTTRIVERALKEAGDCAVIIVHNLTMKRHLESRWPELKGRVIVYDYPTCFRGLNAEAVYLDHIVSDHYRVPLMFRSNVIGK